MHNERVLQQTINGSDTAMDELKKQLVAAIPQMMLYARSRVGHTDEANELVQEALERILKRLPQLSGAEVNFIAYGKRVIRNVHVERWRASRRTVQLDDAAFEEVCSQSGISTTYIDTLKVFRKLSEQCQSLLGLVAERYKYAEIALILEMSEGAVAGAISRCRSAFLTFMKGGR